MYHPVSLPQYNRPTPKRKNADSNHFGGSKIAAVVLGSVIYCIYNKLLGEKINKNNDLVKTLQVLLVKTESF